LWHDLDRADGWTVVRVGHPSVQELRAGMTSTDETCPPLSYRELQSRVRELGLLRLAPWYYAGKIASTVLMFLSVWSATVLVGDSWAQVAAAACLGFCSVQVGLLGHD